MTETLKGTLRKFYYVDCSFEGCEEQDEFWGLGWTKGTAGISLLERGWTHQRDMWVCPDHALAEEDDEE